MTNPPSHYLNFAPVEAVQYDGGDEATALALTWVPSGWDSYKSVEWCYVGNEITRLNPGDWLVKHPDGMVTVQDQEPPRVERWEWSNSRYDGPVRSVCSEYDAREFHDADPEKYLLWRRPVLNNNWTGDWEEVTG